jgi:hypothetical protein
MSAHISRLLRAVLPAALLFAALPQVAVAQGGLQINRLLGECTLLSLSHDGHLLAASDYAGRISVLDAATGTYLRQVDPLGLAEKIDFLAGGDSAAAQMRNGRIVTINMADGRMVSEIAPAFGSGVMATTPSGDKLAYVDRNQSIQLLTMSADGRPSGRKTLTTPFLYKITALAVSRSGSRVAIVDESGQLHVWFPANGTLTHSPENRFSAAKARFVGEDVVFLDDTPIVLELGAGSAESLGNHIHLSVVEGTAPKDLLGSAADGAGLSFVGGVLRGIRFGGDFVYDPKLQSEAQPTSYSGKPAALAQSSDGISFICGDSLAAFRRGSAQPFWQVMPLTYGNSILDGGSSDGGKIAVADAATQGTAVWDSNARNYDAEFPPVSRNSFPSLTGLGPNGKTFFSSDSSDMITIMDVGEENVVSQSRPDLDRENKDAPLPQGIFSFSYSKTERTLAFQNLFRPTAIWLVPQEDRRFGKIGKPITAETLGCTSFGGPPEFSDKDRLLAFGCSESGFSNPAMLIYDLQQSRAVATIPLLDASQRRMFSGFVNAAVFANNEKDLFVAIMPQGLDGDWRSISAQSNSWALVKIAVDGSRRQVISLPASSPPTALAYDAEHGLIYAAGRFGTVAQIDAVTGQVKRLFEGASPLVFGLRYNPTSHRLYILGSDGRLQCIAAGETLIEDCAIFQESGHFAAVDGAGVLYGSRIPPDGVSGSGNEASWRILIPGDGARHYQYGLAWNGSTAPRIASLQKMVSGQTAKLEMTFQPMAARQEFSVAASVNGNLRAVASATFDGNGQAHAILEIGPSAAGDFDVVAFIPGQYVTGPLAKGRIDVAAPPPGRIVGAFVGLDSYEATSGFNNLTRAHSDTVTLAKKMLGDGAAASAVFHQSGKADSYGSHDAVLAFLRQQAASTRPEDTLIISLSGHGATVLVSRERSGFYFLTSDAQERADQDGFDNAISHLEIAGVLDLAQAQNILLIIDACESGGFNLSWINRPGANGIRSFLGLPLVATTKSVFVIAAAPTESETRESYLSGGLLKSLDEAEPSSIQRFLAAAAKNAGAESSYYVVPVVTNGSHDFTISKPR